MFAPEARKKAIAYYRHSAEDKQENSVPIQRERGEKLAAENAVDIIHDEADEGKSGLSADRPGFQRLFNDWILNPDAPDFDYIFVYDVSRWGRFQDQDEAAYYEFRCKQRGKKVIYISRGFPKEEQQLISHLQTSIERYMAAEYSRQLSEKVFYGSVKVSEQGFSAGGMAAYGMTRVLLDESKKPIKNLKKGEWKSISNQRITFAPANDDATKVVADSFNLLTNQWYTPKEIADFLNAEGVPSANGGAWNRGKIMRILTNETYTGTRLYNKTWSRLHQKQRPNPRSEWVIRHDAFEAVINRESFKQAQEHLYWLMPSKWKRGINKIKKAKRIVDREILALLEKEGIANQDTQQTLKKLPIILGISFYIEGTKRWCFVISESMRDHPFALGVAIAIDEHDPIDELFLVPTDRFTTTNFITFSAQDDHYGEYKISKEEMEEKLKILFQKTIDSKSI